MGLRPMASDKVEQPCSDARVGPPSYAASDAGAGLGLVWIRTAPGRNLGRATLPEHLCQQSYFYRFWPAPPYRYRGHVVFLIDVVALCGNMAEPQPKECRAVWTEPGGRTSFEIHRRYFIFRFCGHCSQHTLARCVRSTHWQT